MQHQNLRYYRPPLSFTEACVETDICVYGGNAAGIAAAIAAARMGARVELINPAAHPGGMTTGGLGFTDFGNKDAIGGLAREFYRKLGVHYGHAGEVWSFEPSAATSTLQSMMEEWGVVGRSVQFLDTMLMAGGRIAEIRMQSGLRVRAKFYIDASYEGDLMAMAGVRCRIGRESNGEYGETLNGAQVWETHQFDGMVDPYVVEGEADSGFLPGVEAGPIDLGAGDSRVQAYNFRLCLTQRSDIRLPWNKPKGYERSRYELLARYFRTGWSDVFRKFDAIANGKTDTNNHGAVSSDLIGGSYAYPGSSYAVRENIFQDHVAYQMGLFWFLANDTAVPAAIRERMSSWGPCRDEFVDTGHWPHQLYVREARRMMSDYVVTEHDCRGARTAEDSIALGAYTMDSHNCRRFVRNGRVWNEGDVQMPVMHPYPISYRAIVPARGQCTNILVPVCFSASHIAYGSARMEPVFMSLGQAAAIAASVALENNFSAVQDVPYADLKPALDDAKLHLHYRDAVSGEISQAPLGDEEPVGGVEAVGAR